jgi:hypothetical protein
MKQRRMQSGAGPEQGEVETALVCEESPMPIYVHCPHCEHPVVLPAAVHGRYYRCRQCNGFYVIQMTTSVDPEIQSESYPTREKLKPAV